MNRVSTSEFNSIGIVLRPELIKDYTNLVPNLTSWLTRRKKSVLFLDKEKERVSKLFNGKPPRSVEFIKEEEIAACSNLIISLGGDGTLIGAARLVKNSTVPIFGVNLGHLGFLTEFTKTEFYEELAKVFENDVTIVKFPVLMAKVYSRKGVRFSDNFVNDAVISKHDIARLFTISVGVNDAHVYNLSGDGLIVSSAIGSTAYSLAAGGPIMHPEVAAHILTPICPHGLTHRPMVIPESYVVDIRVINSKDNVMLTLDGQKAVSITENDVVKISKDAKHAVHLIKCKERNYFHTLKEKFDHGSRE